MMIWKCSVATTMTALLSSLLLLNESESFVIPGAQRTKQPIVAPLEATWSDIRAVREYQDFLNSGQQQVPKAPDGPCVIVAQPGGDLDMANAIARMGMGDDVFCAPGYELPQNVGNRQPNEAYPIYITLPPALLREFLANLPQSFLPRRRDFVFISGGPKYGNIEDVLKDFGYCREDMTQFLASGLYITSNEATGDFMVEDQAINMGVDAQGMEKWTGECAACGKWCGHVEKRLERTGIRCRTLFYREWRRIMWERAIFDAVFNLIGAVRNEPTKLSDVANYYGQEVSNMVWGISSVLRGSKAITMTYGFEERLFAMAEYGKEGQKQCAIPPNMFPFLYAPFERAHMVNQYMCYAKQERGLFPEANLQLRQGEEKPIIKEGVLRADGVV